MGTTFLHEDHGLKSIFLIFIWTPVPIMAAVFILQIFNWFCFGKSTIFVEKPSNEIIPEKTDLHVESAVTLNIQDKNQETSE